MKNERNAFRAGLFILIAIALTMTVILSIKGGGRFAEGKVIRTVSFKLSDDVGGLRVGDDVRVGGGKGGAGKEIEGVGLEGTSPTIQVSFSLPGRFKLRENAHVGVQATLTGAASLNIESLGGGREYAETEVVVGRADPKTSLLASLSDAGGDIAAMAK